MRTQQPENATSELDHARNKHAVRDAIYLLLDWILETQNASHEEEMNEQHPSEASGESTA